MKILVTMPVSEVRDTFFRPEVVKRLEEIAEVEWNETEEQLGPEELKEKIKDVDVVMTGWGSERFDREVLESASKLKIIAHTGGSVAGIVSDYLYDKGIVVLSGNKLYAESTAEGVLTYMLCALRRIVYFRNEIENGNWPENSVPDEGLLDQNIGIVGFGAVAKNLAKFLVPFRAKLRVYDPHVSDEVLKEYGAERASLEDIFANSKIITIHAAKTPETYHMIGKELLESIQDGALLVNAARGSIIDTDALEAELHKGRFKAALDVYEVEPLPSDSRLRGLPNVLLIPHRGGPTVDRRTMVTMALFDDILKVLDGRKAELEIGREYAMAMTQ